MADPAGVGYAALQPDHVPSTGVTSPVRVDTETVASFPNVTRT